MNDASFAWLFFFSALALFIFVASIPTTHHCRYPICPHKKEKP